MDSIKTAVWCLALACSALAPSSARHTVFVGLREDKPAIEVRREAAAKP